MAQDAATTMPTSTTSDIIRDLATFQERYRRLELNLHVQHRGKDVAIHLPSGRWTVGDSPIEAFAAMRKEYGSDADCWCQRIGDRKKAASGGQK